jgi:hypothetical protein
MSGARDCSMRDTSHGRDPKAATMTTHRRISSDENRFGLRKSVFAI